MLLVNYLPSLVPLPHKRAWLAVCGHMGIPKELKMKRYTERLRGAACTAPLPPTRTRTLSL